MSNDLPKGKPILCMDFDGVIHSYTSGWKGADVIPDPIVDGAIEFLAEATKYFEVHIFSSRSHQNGGMDAMKDWLWIQVTGEDFLSNCNRWSTTSELDGHDSHWLFKIKWSTTKPAAFLSIDDRGFCFTGKFPDPKELLEFKPWHKKKKIKLGKVDHAPMNSVCEKCGRRYCDHPEKQGRY